MPTLDLDDQYFQRDRVIDVDVAVVGVSRKRWCCVPSATTMEKAKASMFEKRYDVLPVDDGEDYPVVEYFTTWRWNDFREIARRRICHREVIPINTGIRDALKSFALDQDAYGERRRTLFLGNEKRICGFISIAHINCRAVRTYLFGLFNELETLVADCVKAEFSEVAAGTTTLRDLDKKVLKQFERDRSHGMEVSLVEYLYLPQLLQLFLDSGLATRLLGLEISELLGKLRWRVGNLRNRVDHPVRTMLKAADEVENLWEEIDLIEEIIFRLLPLSYHGKASVATAE